MTRLLALIAASFVFFLVAADLVARPEAAEPPQEYSLEIDGRAHPVTLGKVLSVTIGGKAVKLRLTAKPNRRFDNAAGVTFDYPSNFAFAFDGDQPGMSHWTLDGNDCVIQLFEFKEHPTGVPVLQEMIVGGLIAQYGAENVTRSTGSLALGSRKLKTAILRVSLAGVVLQQDVVSFLVGERKFVFIVQDSLTDDNKMTKETAGVRALLKKTFKAP